MKALILLALLTGCATHRMIYTAPEAFACATEGKILGAIQIDDETNHVEAKLCAAVRIERRE